jgi:hypothetical protein
LGVDRRHDHDAKDRGGRQDRAFQVEGDDRPYKRKAQTANPAAITVMIRK